MPYDLSDWHANRLKKPFALSEIMDKIADLRESSPPSDRVIAERVAVSHQTVGRARRLCRAEDKSDGAWWGVNGRNGKVYGIGFSFFVQCAITNHPDLSDRAIAKAIGVSHQTVMRERKGMVVLAVHMDQKDHTFSAAAPAPT